MTITNPWILRPYHSLHVILAAIHTKWDFYVESKVDTHGLWVLHPMLHLSPWVQLYQSHYGRISRKLPQGNEYGWVLGADDTLRAVCLFLNFSMQSGEMWPLPLEGSKMYFSVLCHHASHPLCAHTQRSSHPRWVMFRSHVGCISSSKVFLKSRVVAVAPEWKWNRCQLCVCVCGGPQRYRPDVRRDSPLLFSNVG